MEAYVGIEIGGTKLQIVTGNQNADIIRRFRFAVNPSAGAEEIRTHIEEVIANLGSNDLKAIGVGFGGPVDRSAGNIWTSYHVKGWSDFPFRDWLQRISALPVRLENDANVAALGEAVSGAGKKSSVLFYVTLGSGVGGGLVVNKAIYHGVVPGETEFGHVLLDKSGKTIQSSCSGWAVNEKIKAAAKRNSNSKLAELAKVFPGAEAKALRDALLFEDSDAKTILNETIDDLAFGLSHAVHLIHPEMIILGGGLSLIGEPLRKLVEEKLPNYLMDAFQPGPAIRLSALKEDAVPVGALNLAIQNSNL